MTTRTPASNRGLTLVEAVISIVLVGVLLTGALRTVGISTMGQRLMADRARGQQLAYDLMNEILTQEYMASDSAIRVFGLEIGKLSVNRSQFTDVDDYNGWTESPPVDRSGNAIAGTAGWRRTVSVAWADPATWAPTNQPNTGVKLITVTATLRGAVISTATGYRSVAWTDTIPAAAGGSSNYAPTASVVASKTTDSGRLDTTLNGAGSSDRDNDTLSYVWNFGDGATGAGVSVSHTYSTPGTYTATLTVYDGRGGIGAASVVLTVTP